jgi:hypothetical protein
MDLRFRSIRGSTNQKYPRNRARRGPTESADEQASIRLGALVHGRPNAGTDIPTKKRTDTPGAYPRRGTLPSNAVRSDADRGSVTFDRVDAWNLWLR